MVDPAILTYIEDRAQSIERSIAPRKAPTEGMIDRAKFAAMQLRLVSEELQNEFHVSE